MDETTTTGCYSIIKPVVCSIIGRDSLEQYSGELMVGGWRKGGRNCRNLFHDYSNSGLCIVERCAAHPHNGNAFHPPQAAQHFIRSPIGIVNNVVH